TGEKKEDVTKSFQSFYEVKRNNFTDCFSHWHL
ncbi:MAG: hypothetical protein ACI8SA_002469, partial [Dokdonia sp.]